MPEDLPDLQTQAGYWNTWNQSRHGDPGLVSRRQAEVVISWIRSLGRTDLDILDVGCGAGWLEPALVPFGRVTATDLADEWVERARLDLPQVTFLAGDFATIPLPEQSFDIVVTLEVLSHVPDRAAFVAKIGRLLRPGGLLLLATQNRPVLKYLNDVPPPAEGQLRYWVDRRELRDLLGGAFEVLELFTVTPRMSRLTKHVGRARAEVTAPQRPVDADDEPSTRTGMGWRLLEQVGLGWTIMCRAQRR